MEFIDHALLETARAIINEAMRHSACRMDNITFQIGFRQSIFFSTSSEEQTSQTSAWKYNQQCAFVPEEHKKNTFGLCESDDVWEAISCIQLNEHTLFPIIKWPIQTEQRDRQQEEIVRLMRLFSERSLNVLSHYFFFEGNGIDDPSVNYEADLLNHAVSLSENIECVACIDNEGFILGLSDQSETAEGIALRLSQYHAAIGTEMKSLKSASISNVTFSGKSSSVLFGVIDGTPLILAISTRAGNRSPSLSYFSYICIKHGMKNRFKRTGSLWGSPVLDTPASGFFRDSWLNHPKLIVKGKFVSKAGSEIFHLPSCRLLGSTNTKRLTWYETRKAVIQARLHPCRICNP